MLLTWRFLLSETLSVMFSPINMTIKTIVAINSQSLVYDCNHNRERWVSLDRLKYHVTTVDCICLVLSLGQIDPECVCVCVSVCVTVCVRACVISRKPWLVRFRVRVSLSNSPGVIETNGLSSSILLGQHKGYIDEQHGRSQNGKPKGAGCSIGNKPHLLHVSVKDMNQTLICKCYFLISGTLWYLLYLSSNRVLCILQISSSVQDGNVHIQCPLWIMEGSGNASTILYTL